MFIEKKFSIILFCGILLDQILKFLAEKYLSFFTPIYIIKPLISLQLVYNYGAAYGILQNKKLFLLSVSVIIISLSIIFYKKIAQNQILKFGLTFLLIGALGNFIDRLIRGFVVDYIDIKIFPVFNLADICINIGIFFFILDIIIDYLKQKKSNAKV
jgi:signal peptidase II